MKKENKMKIDDMVIVITGAHGATGSVLFEYFCKKSAVTVGTLRNLDSKWKEKSEGFLTKCDLLELDQVEGCVELIRDRLGKIDAWINVVGGFTMGKPVEEIESDWDRMHILNFTTTLNCIKSVMPVMKETGYGRIINFGSKAGEKGMGLAGPYTVSKAAVHSLTKTVSQEVEGDITCNAVMPDIIDTPANREAMPDVNFNSWTKPIDIADKIESIILAKTNGQLIYV